MKLPDLVTHLLHKNQQTREYYFSLIPDIDAVSVAVWYIDADKIPHVVSDAFASVPADNWDDRIKIIDSLLSQSEDKAHIEKAITKTVFGLPGKYVTPDGNITPEIRPHLKKLSTLLELNPVGFVPLSQAYAYYLKSVEGIPTSAILLSVSGDSLVATIYRIGAVVREHILLTENVVPELEVFLKDHQDGDVLPSRILLIGNNPILLEDVRTKLLKHPWPTRTNFLHFPKIELVSKDDLLKAVSLAGASELASMIGQDEQQQVEGGDYSNQQTVIAQPTRQDIHDVQKESTEDTVSYEESDDHDNVPIVEDEGIVAENEDKSEEARESEFEKELDHPDENNPEVKSLSDDEEVLESEENIENIKMVTPEALGFRAGDMLEVGNVSKRQLHESGVLSSVSDVASIREKVYREKKSSPFAKLKIPPFRLPVVHMPHIAIPSLGAAYGIGFVGLGIVAFIAYGLYYFIPRVTVTAYVLPMSFHQTQNLVVDPDKSTIDQATDTIPGKKIEKSVSGEKTITVTGKKKVGEPARGTVTIYNKVTSSKTLAKGTVFVANGLSFTLDAAVTIASASESIGSITFGHADGELTAVAIGTDSNVPVNTDFGIKDQSMSVISARNASAFSGGTSRDITVVTRADMDALTKALTDTLVSSAKDELSSDTGVQHMIDSSVKTQVTQKVFDQELDQETKQLHGKMTITISGVAYDDADIKELLLSLVKEKIPGGYALDDTQTILASPTVLVKKDGTINVSATLTAVAIPVLDQKALQKSLAGKQIDEAIVILKKSQGVSSAEFHFTLSPSSKRLPINSTNITVTKTVQK
jgi:hypothetical protein